MKLKSLIFISILCSLAALSPALGQEGFIKADSPKPNVLFICIDDLRADIGVNGNKSIKTPNLDKLAKKGYSFKNHFANIPTCGASRYALLTAQLPQTIGDLSNEVASHRISNQPRTAVPETFIDHLRRQGYLTIGIGKISHSADGYLYPYTENKSNRLELPHSWDEMLFNPGQWRTGWNAFFAQANGESRISLKGMVKPYEKANVDDLGYPDGLSAQLAIRKIDSLAKEKQPFFLGVGFFKPHLPFNAPAKYWDLYNEDKIPLSPAAKLPLHVDHSSLTNSEEFNQYLLGEEKPSLKNTLSEKYARKIIHGYYASVGYVDAQVGKVIDALERNGLMENTIIVVWGDHGWHLGDQQIWGKHSLFNEALHSTLIIKPIGKTNKGKVITEIVSSVDIYPSLMDLLDMAMPHSKYDGNSFADIMRSGKSKGWKNNAIAYFNQGVSLRTPRYRISKYYRTSPNPIELFDHKKDPYELNNIAKQRPDLVEKLLKDLGHGEHKIYTK